MATLRLLAVAAFCCCCEAYMAPIHCPSPHRTRAVVALAKTKQKPKGKGKAVRATKISTRGFGSAPKSAGAKLLDEPKYAALYEWLNTSPLTNLKKVAVGEFDGGLRGVMALQDIAPGEEIVAIPATLAIDLGTDSSDPLPPARRLLAERRADADEGEYAAYWAVLPQPDSPDLCTPDFFSDAELDMLQWPPLIDETRRRAAVLQKVLSADSGGDEHDGMRMLQWGVWTVLSRVLTVVDPVDPAGHKLLIPFIDMFNHKGGTKHYLTGRTDGMLRVVAGAPVRAGEQIFIKYGIDATSNAEFVAHYGFYDPSPTAAAADADLVRQQAAAAGGGGAAALDALRQTSLEEDEAALAAEPPPPYQQQLALRLRLGLKRAAERQNLLP